MHAPERSRFGWRVVVVLGIALLFGVEGASAGGDVELGCRRTCSAELRSCKTMAFSLRHGCYDLCRKQPGTTDCRTACPIAVYRGDIRGCFDDFRACHSECRTTSPCPEACRLSFATCSATVADACDACNDSSKTRYRDCRHALRPRRCRSTVLAAWTECFRGCKGTLADAFAPCGDARAACLAGCRSPGGALVD